MSCHNINYYPFYFFSEEDEESKDGSTESIATSGNMYIVSHHVNYQQSWFLGAKNKMK